MNSSLKNWNSTQRLQAFTLVELLLVIAIISVLSTMAIGVMRSAQEDAKEAATQARIQQIESILAVELEDYEVRRMPVSIGTLFAYVRANPLADSRVGVQVRNLKRRILQDIISAEYPRPIVNNMGVFQYNNSIGVFPTTQPPINNVDNPLPTASPVGFTTWLNNNYPGLSTLLGGRLPGKVQTWANFKTREGNAALTANFNLPGEYLYQSLARIDIDGAPATELLGQQAIGDSDDDGYLEVVDAWGDPLQLRIWQVEADEIDTTSDLPFTGQAANPRTDVWRDAPLVDFDIRTPSGFPTGYSVINSTEPREVNKIRFEVISTRLQF